MKRPDLVQVITMEIKHGYHPELFDKFGTKLLIFIFRMRFKVGNYTFEPFEEISLIGKQVKYNLNKC